jgi:hypothetical protein
MDETINIMFKRRHRRKKKAYKTKLTTLTTQLCSAKADLDASK